MTSKIAMMAAKYLAREVKKFAASDEPDRGELLGKYKITPVGNGLFWCEIDAHDPLRYRDEKTGLEFSPALGAFKTDKGSIPKIVQRVKALGLQLKEDDAERSYLIHDSAYQSGTVRVRKSGADWSLLTLTREQADVLMHDCLSADSTPEGKPISRATAFAVYQAVRRFSGGPWKTYRAQDKVRVAAVALAVGGAVGRKLQECPRKASGGRGGVGAGVGSGKRGTGEPDASARRKGASGAGRVAGSGGKRV